MPRVDVPVQRIPNNGSIPNVEAGGVAGDAANDHDMVNDGQTEIWFFNGGGLTINATILSQPDSLNRLGNIPIAIPAGASAVVPPLTPRSAWNVSGRVEIDVDTAAGLTIAGVNRTTRR